MNQDHPSLFSLSILHQWALTLLAFFLVAFGQPAWLPLNGLLASAIGYALFWRVLLAYPMKKHRFLLGTLWFGAVQLVQLHWFVSHPYWYIYTVYFFLILGMGIQFGLTSLFIRKELFLRKKFFHAFVGMLPIAGFWILCEWMRLFVLSGFSWNPIGMALTGNTYALQAASLMGIYGLSFWVILVNLLALWAWMQKSFASSAVWLSAVVLPYAFGFFHLAIHEAKMENKPKTLDALLVQTAFAPEELQGNTQEKTSLISHVIHEWSRILEIVKKHHGKPIHLIVLPEFVVPYGTYSGVYPLIEVKKAFSEIFGPESLAFLPSVKYPLATFQKTPQGLQIFVNNAYWAQGLANYFQSDLLVGLEDAEDISPAKREYYSAAILFRAEQKPADDFAVERYAKRVLVPLGEYIPFEACKKLAEGYGVFCSFTCGKEAVVMQTHGISFSPSICYEETFGNMMREGRQKGADLFVNLTSDVWYPNSKLPRQHLDHARLRTVENGVPLIRACNTGITSGIDSFGRNIAILGGEHPEQMEWISDSLLVRVPLHTYQTLYSKFGDFLIIGFSFFFLSISFVDKK